MPWKTVKVPKNTNNVTTGIINFLESEGHVALRINTQGQFDQIGESSYKYRELIYHVSAVRIFGYIIGKWRKSNSTEGVSDIICCLQPTGRFLGVEVKFGRDTASKVQKIFLKKIVDAGGFSYIAKDLETFQKYYFKEVKPNL